jgi:CBS domain-containing protein
VLVDAVMTSEVETVGVEESLLAAARRMRARDVGALPVVCRGELVGFVTDRDLVVRAVAEGLPPALTPVRAAMTPQIVTCTPEETVDTAAARMAEHSIRRIVVVDRAGRPVGMLTADDLAVHARSLAADVVERTRFPEGFAPFRRWLPIS